MKMHMEQQPPPLPPSACRRYRSSARRSRRFYFSLAAQPPPTPPSAPPSCASQPHRLFFFLRTVQPPPSPPSTTATVVVPTLAMEWHEALGGTGSASPPLPRRSRRSGLAGLKMARAASTASRWRASAEQGSGEDDYGGSVVPDAGFLGGGRDGGDFVNLKNLLAQYSKMLIGVREPSPEKKSTRTSMAEATRMKESDADDPLKLYKMGLTRLSKKTKSKPTSEERS
ncbi:hypothetical protein OsJ_09633 [Oryza sativa Japonica Group]|uniref:Uncharacterized protein n=2 Tax=Oryza sativa subsp. japonica TaxID=39947 RepID=A3AEQ1_ORYSJ|nr:hypothetical protein OsJ_09633 [Oryza sativa Japonica Group]